MTLLCICTVVSLPQFDLAESRPAPVLRTIWDNLLAREAQGDALAGHVRRCGQQGAGANHGWLHERPRPCIACNGSHAVCMLLGMQEPAHPGGGW